MSDDRRMSMNQAIGLIQAGDSVAMGLALEHAIPFAAGHEMIRQELENLTLIGPISDMLFDQLIGAGRVQTVRAAWVGNVSAGSGYCFRRAVEAGELEMEDHSNFSLALSLEAGRLGVPYLPTRSLLGTDILKENDNLIQTEDPIGGEPVVLVPAIRPDWAVVHVQRADDRGNAHMWGNTGVSHQAIGAANRIIVIAEELVSSEVIKSDPNRVAITHERVGAVVECPGGAHPSPVSGYYNRDHDHFLDYHDETKTEDGFRTWAAEWIHGVSDRAEYMDRSGGPPDISRPSYAEEVPYGQ